MTCIIIDDEPLARSIIKEYLQFYPALEIVAECSNGFEGVKAIQHFQPDLIFLDIQMPKLTGFEMLELLDTIPQIIFTTAYDEYALKAFENNAIDYLLKPFSKERFDKALQKVLIQKKDSTEQINILNSRMQSPQQAGRVVLKEGSKIRIIPLAQIQFIEAADDYVKIITSDGNFLKKKTMQYFEQTLPEQQFVRIHRSYIINVQLITRVDSHEKEAWQVLLKTGQQLTVSKAGYLKLKVVLGL